MAAMYFYEPGCIVHGAPAEMDAVTSVDIERFITTAKERIALAAQTPLEPPFAFLANPSPDAVDLVWDAPRQSWVTGYEIQWRLGSESDWKSIHIAPLTHWHKEGLTDGRPMRVRMRSLRGSAHSDWTPEQACTPGAVTGATILTMLSHLPLLTLVKVVALSLWSWLRPKLQ